MTDVTSSPQFIEGVDVEALASAVRNCPGVDDLAAGALGSVASYLPGRTVAGIAVTRDRVTIQVRSRWDAPVPAVAAQVRSAVAALVGQRQVDIVIADIAEPASTTPEAVLMTPAPTAAAVQD